MPKVKTIRRTLDLSSLDEGKLTPVINSDLRVK